MADILIVDDDSASLSILQKILAAEGHNISSTTSGLKAMNMLRDQAFDLMITDLHMPDCDGISLMKHAKSFQRNIEVIVISVSDAISDAVAAMKFGAFDYISKPFKFDELSFTVNRALSYEELATENRLLKKTAATHNSGYSFIIGESQPMREVFKIIEKVAATPTTVLILGESGTGKELIAKAIHNASPRRSQPFVKVNCTAMQETLLESELFGHLKGSFTGANENKKGLFEVADSGTIFLDEIGSIPLSMQAKLLRTLQEKEIRRVGDTADRSIDVRVVAATNENLQEKIADGSFREDLFFRLSVIPVHLPPLRERRDGIPLLVVHWLHQFEKEQNRHVKVLDDAMRALREYSWPGNIRQLENLVKRTAILSDSGEIHAKDLPQEIIGFQKTEKIINFNDYVEQSADEFISLKEYLKNVETTYIRNVVKHFDGDKESAAKTLGISLATLYRKI